MASREEEKRQRREARQAAEAEAAKGAKRQKQLQFLLGALLVIGVIVGVVLAVSGGSKSSSADNPAPGKGAQNAGKVPPPSNRDLTSAAKDAGCVLVNPPDEGRSHVSHKVKYKSNPPVSGDHNPEPALDGIYDAGKEPAPEHFVHALEHGRIEFQYKPGTPAAFVSKLETLASEPLVGKAAYKILLFENNTNMPYQVAVTAWDHYIGCKTIKEPQIFDALRDFRLKYVDKGPEPGIPPNN